MYEIYKIFKNLGIEKEDLFKQVSVIKQMGLDLCEFNKKPFVEYKNQLKLYGFG